MTYLNIRDIVMLDKPLITFKFNNNNTIERRVVWESLYRGSYAFSSRGTSRLSSSSWSDTLGLNVSWINVFIPSSSIVFYGAWSSSSMGSLSSPWIFAPPCSSTSKTIFFGLLWFISCTFLGRSTYIKLININKPWSSTNHQVISYVYKLLKWYNEQLTSGW